MGSAVGANRNPRPKKRNADRQTTKHNDTLLLLQKAGLPESVFGRRIAKANSRTVIPCHVQKMHGEESLEYRRVIAIAVATTPANVMPS